MDASIGGEIATDLQAFLKSAGLASSELVEEKEASGKTVFKVTFSNAWVEGGMITVRPDGDINVAESENSTRTFSDFYETRHYLVSRYVR